MSEEILRRLVIKSFHVQSVDFSSKPGLRSGLLEISGTAGKTSDLIKKADVTIIRPGDPDKYVNTIMDIVPISVKVLGEIGEGITHTLTGVYVMITGVDEDGRQMHEFGSSEGMLGEKMVRGRAGTPGEDDIIIHLDYLIQGGLPYERKLPMAIFNDADDYIQEIRNVLKDSDGTDATEAHEFCDRVRKDKTKILIIKQIAGQGAMYDNMLFPKEPSGMKGLSIIDMANMPVLLSPNEYRDGALRAMV